MPYRTVPPSFVPIDMDSIPDCERTELARIEHGIHDNDQRCRSLYRRQHAKAYWTTVKVSVPLIPIVFFSLKALGVFQFWTALFLGFAALVATLIFGEDVASYLTGRTMLTNDEAMKLEAQLPLLQKRLSQLESLERLTGKRERALELLEEVRRFNDDLQNLSETDCSPSNISAIADRRAELTASIGAFRQKALATSDKEDAMLLNATND